MEITKYIEQMVNLKYDPIAYSSKDRIKGLKLPIKITKSLSYIIGVLAGDGNINVRQEKHDYTIKCCGNPKDEIEYYNNIIFELFYQEFGIKLKMKLLDSGETYGFVFHSKALVTFLTKVIGLPIGKKYNHLKIPYQIKRNRTLLKYFLRGLADTDFGLSFKKRGSTFYPVICGASNTKCFMEEVESALSYLGMDKPTKYYDYVIEDSLL